MIDLNGQNKDIVAVLHKCLSLHMDKTGAGGVDQLLDRREAPSGPTSTALVEEPVADAKMPKLFALILAISVTVGLLIANSSAAPRAAICV